MIRRVYENPFEGHTRRHFCGFCGTPLTYWSDAPRGEANYIQVTMGSLCRDDLGDLEEMGLVPESPSSPGSTSSSRIGGAGRGLSSPIGGGDGMVTAEDEDARVQQQKQQQQLVMHRLASPTTVSTSAAVVPLRGGRETTGIPWFDTILEGSRLAGRLKTTKVTRQSANGTRRVEWEIVEYTDNDPGTPSTSNGKRKMDDRDDADDAHMEGVGQ